MTLLGPLFWYELRRLPRRRMHLWRVLYAGALLLGLLVVYLRTFRGLPAREALTDPAPLDLAGNAAFAETYLMAFLAVQQIAVIALTPLYAAGSIADEKERGTLDFLLSSPLPRYQILLGKLLARLVYVGSILAVGLPVLMLTFLFGGVDFEHLLAGFVVSVITAIFLGTLGLMFACVKPNLRETLPGLGLTLLFPALVGMCGGCLPQLSAASPITAPLFLFQMWLTGDPSRDLTWQLVAIFTALHLPPSLLLFITALMATGEKSHWVITIDIPIPAREVTVQFEAPSQRIRRTYDVRPLRYDDDPLTWKARGFHLPWFSPERGCFVIGLLSIAVGGAFIFLLVLFAVMANDLAMGKSIGRAVHVLALTVFVPMIALYPAFVGARVASGLGRERAGQTLLTLFTLPIERSFILKAIARAIVLRDRGLYWISGGILVFGVVAGGVDWLGALAAATLMIGCVALALAFGLWLSVHVEMPTRASLIFVSVWGGLLLLPWFISPFVDPAWRDSIELICPPYGMVESLDGTAGQLPMRVSILTGLAMFCAAAALEWHAVRSFEREGR